MDDGGQRLPGTPLQASRPSKPPWPLLGPGLARLGRRRVQSSPSLVTHTWVYPTHTPSCPLTAEIVDPTCLLWSISFVVLCHAVALFLMLNFSPSSVFLVLENS